MTSSNANKPVSGIVERAMLVDLTVSRFTTSRKDKTVTEDVKAKYKATGDVGRYNKNLFPQDPPELSKVSALAVAIGIEHRRMTLPWAQGWRILPRDLHTEYAARMQQLRSEYEQAVREMTDAFPQLIAGAKGRLADLFNPLDYPSPGEFQAAHGVTVRFMPVPDAGDFRIDLDADTMEGLRAAYEADMEEHLKGATRDAWERLYKVVEGLATACERIDDKIAAESDRIVLKRAVIDNIISMTAILPKLNVANDPKLEEVRQEVSQRLGKLKVADIKDDLAVRASVKKDTDAILKKMAPFVNAGK